MNQNHSRRFTNSSATRATAGTTGQLRLRLRRVVNGYRRASPIRARRSTSQRESGPSPARSPARLPTLDLPTGRARSMRAPRARSTARTSGRHLPRTRLGSSPTTRRIFPDGRALGRSNRAELHRPQILPLHGQRVRRGRQALLLRGALVRRPAEPVGQPRSDPRRKPVRTRPPRALHVRRE